jgi:hypothetical protein
MLTRIETSTIDTASSATMNLGIDGERARHRHTLPLPAAELVRVLGNHITRRRQIDDFEQFERARFGGDAVLHLVVAQQRRGDDVADRLCRVERRVRVLMDDLHRLAVTAEGGAVEALDRRPLEDDFTGSRLQQTSDHAPGRALAAAALAHQADRLTWLDGEGDSIDGGDGLLTLAKLLGEVAHFDDRRHQATSTATAMTSVKLRAPRCSGLRCSSASTSRQCQHAAV